MRLGAILLLLACPALAQDRKPIPIHFDHGAINIMPGLTGGQRYQLRRWMSGPWKKLLSIDAQIRKVSEEFRREKDMTKRAKMVDHRKRLQDQRNKVRQQGRAQLDKIGLKPAQIQRLNSIPRGALQQERYNHQVMLEAPNLSPAQRETVQACIAAADGTMMALVRQRNAVGQTYKDQDPKMRQRLASDLNNRIRAIEKRFWVAMYYVLTPEQMRATKPLRSPNYQRVGDHRNHLYMLPALTPIQASRINALLTETQSESAADDAMIRTLRRRQQQKGLDSAERTEIQKQLRDAYQRRGRIYSENTQAIRDLMTDEQRDAWNAIPPQLNGGEVGRNILGNLRGITLRPGQPSELQAHQRAADRKARELQRALREKTKDLRESGMGSDSPQMMEMNTMQRGVQGDRARLYRKAGHTVCLEVLAPDQLGTWVSIG
ncbi:MAG: hypothetical protein AAGD14_09565 [Planctomycetota bacterium]